MSSAPEHYHTPDPAEQLSLFSQGELAELRSSFASRPRKGDIAPRKARRQDVEECSIQGFGATQLQFPGI
jgi:hypothetical protein